MSPSANPEKSKPERERQDWGIVLIILLIGFLCVIVSAQWALRFSPSWTLNADMGSNLDLNSEFLTSRPVVFFEPVDPAILTQPGWMAGFLTPGANIVTGTPLRAVTRTNTAHPTALGTTLVPTNTVAVTNTSTTVPTSTLIWLPLPATATRKPGNTDVPNTSVPPPATAINTSPAPIPSADLAISLTDNAAVYAPGTPRTYIITVSNNGPDNVTGATVTDNFPSQISSFLPGSGCTSTGGATCGWIGSGNINDVINLPIGSTITYTANVTTNSDPVNLQNTALVTGPAGYAESLPGNESATDTDTLLTYATRPSALGTQNCSYGSGFGCTYILASGETITFNSIPPITHIAGPDLIYYERPTHVDSIEMDFVRIEISDGLNWYTVFYWGGGVIGNSNISSFPENDNEIIPFTSLYPYPGTGVTIDISGITAPGPFPYIRVYAPVEPAPPQDGIAIDAILTP
jgi:uncharacterized repeat protein (TIGR01451 family)